MPSRVQSPFREQTDMGFWDKSLRIFLMLTEFVVSASGHP